MRRASLFILASGFVLVSSRRAHGEPMFLSKQYGRCTACHYSESGGGLLTPYGRSLTRQELSTTGRNATGPGDAQTNAGTGREEAFLWGLLGDKLGPVHVGFDVRPAHLQYSFAGVSADQNLFMNADFIAAYQAGDWTVYGEIGREPQSPGWKIDSYEYWVSHRSENGLGFRVGRFLPAYGIRLADHTAFTRGALGFDKYDQIYGLEVSQTTDRYLVQVSVGPGRADSIIQDDGRRAVTATGRLQIDLGPRTAFVASGLYRNASQTEPRNGAGGAAFGFAPTSRLNTWTEADAQFQQGTAGGTGYIVANETAFEAVRGLWLKFSPQIRTTPGDTSAGVVRMVFEADLLPRTHWNVDISYYRDRARTNDFVTHTLLTQLHLYL